MVVLCSCQNKTTFGDEMVTLFSTNYGIDLLSTEDTNLLLIPSYKCHACTRPLSQEIIQKLSPKLILVLDQNNFLEYQIPDVSIIKDSKNLMAYKMNKFGIDSPVVMKSDGKKLYFVH